MICCGLGSTEAAETEREHKKTANKLQSFAPGGVVFTRSYLFGSKCISIGH